LYSGLYFNVKPSVVELRLGLRAKLRLSVIICVVLDLLPTKKKINRQHRRCFADIETITIYQNFDIFLDDIDTIRYGQYVLGISFGRYIVASLSCMLLAVTFMYTTNDVPCVQSSNRL